MDVLMRAELGPMPGEEAKTARASPEARGFRVWGLGLGFREGLGFGCECLGVLLFWIWGLVRLGLGLGALGFRVFLGKP